MTYHRGSFDEFLDWHENVKMAENISTGGRVGYVKGRVASDKQKTIAYSEAVPHPENADDYLWAFGKYPIPEREIISQESAEQLGWFASDN